MCAAGVSDAKPLPSGGPDFFVLACLPGLSSSLHTVLELKFVPWPDFQVIYLLVFEHPHVAALVSP